MAPDSTSFDELRIRLTATGCLSREGGNPESLA